MRLIKGLFGLAAFTIGFTLGIALWILKLAIPVVCVYFIFAFVTQESNWKLWTMEVRAFFVLLSAVIVYAVYVYEPQESYANIK